MKSALKAMAVKDKAPLASCSKERLLATIQQPRVRCKDLESQLVNMQREIHSNSIEINKTLEDDILSILDKSDLKTSPHMNLFWQQQKKLLASPKVQALKYLLQGRLTKCPMTLSLGRTYVR